MDKIKNLDLSSIITPIVVRYTLYIIATICTATIEFIAQDMAVQANQNQIEVISNVDSIQQR